MKKTLLLNKKVGNGTRVLKVIFQLMSKVWKEERVTRGPMGFQMHLEDNVIFLLLLLHFSPQTDKWILWENSSHTVTSDDNS